MKTYLKYSVLGRISEIREKSLYKILANSFFIGCLFNIINRICAKLKVYLETSKILDYKNMLAEKIFLVPVKMFSIILITVLPANIFLSLIFKINITFSGWIIRGILFFLAIGGISCDVCPEDIAKNSFITRNIIRHKNL